MNNKVRELQRGLYRAAKENRKRIFYSLHDKIERNRSESKTHNHPQWTAGYLVCANFFCKVFGFHDKSYRFVSYLFLGRCQSAIFTASFITNLLASTPMRPATLYLIVTRWILQIQQFWYDVTFVKQKIYSSWSITSYIHSGREGKIEKLVAAIDQSEIRGLLPLRVRKPCRPIWSSGAASVSVTRISPAVTLV